MARHEPACCGTPSRKGTKKGTAIPEPIQSDLDRIGGIAALAARLPKDADLETASQIHHALSDSFRLKMLYLIKDQPLCVCVIKEFFRIADSKLSYHLTILREAGLITGEYHGNWIIYSITDKGMETISSSKR